MQGGLKPVRTRTCVPKVQRHQLLRETLYRVRIPASPPLPRARSVLTARQGFRHRAARTARRDLARIPRSFLISRVRSVLTARQGFRHRAARTACRDSARIPRSFPVSRARSVLTPRQGFRHRAAAPERLRPASRRGGSEAPRVGVHAEALASAGSSPMPLFRLIASQLVYGFPEFRRGGRRSTDALTEASNT